MAVAHLLHGRRGQQRIIGLRPRRRQVAQEIRKIDPLVAEVADRKSVLLADIAEILLLGLRFGSHQRFELRGLAVPLGETDDAAFDDRPVEFEVGLMGVVVGRDLVGGEHRVDRAVDVMLVQFADQQRLPVLLDHLVDIGRRGGEERPRLLQFELFDHPAVDVNPHEGRAVVAREPLRNHRADIAHFQLLAAGARNGRTAREITGQLPATRQQQHTRRDRYFRSQIHIPKGKDTFFTCK